MFPSSSGPGGPELFVIERWAQVLCAFLCGYLYADAAQELPITKFHLTREWKVQREQRERERDT